MQDIHREEDDVQQAMVVPGIADQADHRHLRWAAHPRHTVPSDCLELKDDMWGHWLHQASST